MTTPTPRHGPNPPPDTGHPGMRNQGLALAVAIAAAVLGAVVVQGTFYTAFLPEGETPVAVAPAATETIPPPAPTGPSLAEECEASLRADLETTADEELSPACVSLGPDAAGAILASIAVEYGVTDLASPTAAPAGPANAIPEDGMYLVGKDIKPGTYKAPASENCYWARLKNGDGDLDSIIDNNVSDGQQVVTIRKADYAFETERCGVWVRQ